jgi:hypothetical protein
MNLRVRAVTLATLAQGSPALGSFRAGWDSREWADVGQEGGLGFRGQLEGVGWITCTDEVWLPFRNISLAWGS